MKSWSRPLGYLAAIAIIAGAYYVGHGGRADSSLDTAAALPADPGYAAREAVVIETGFDGRERYRLHARTIRQRIDSGVIDLEGIEMDYHPDAQGRRAGEPTSSGNGERWQLKSERGQVRADGDDVQLDGNVVVTGQAPGNAGPIALTTETLRINTPTEFIETDAPVRLSWSGHRIDALGMVADLKAGTLRLESRVHGEFSPQ